MLKIKTILVSTRQHILITIDKYTVNKNSYSFPFMLLSLLIFSLLLSMGCTFDGSAPVDIYLEHSDRVTPISEHDSTIIKYVPGKLYIIHGKYCGEDRLPGNVSLNPHTVLPGNGEFKEAVIINNGWRLRFQREESEVVGFGTTVRDTELDGKNLNWWAIGIISDEDRDQIIEFCHYYTLIAWTDSIGDYAVTREDIPIMINKRESRHSLGRHSSIHSISRYLYDNAHQDFDSVSILPQGFGFAWADFDEDYFLQAAYQLTPGERFVYGKVRHSSVPYYPPPVLTIPAGTPPQFFIDYVDKSYVSWESHSIFKNGDASNSFYFNDHVVGVAGNRFGMIHPHYSIQPKKERPWNVASLEYGKQQVYTRKYKTLNLPFDFAIPVLTGWNLFLYDDNEQVREIGIWIDSFKWNKKGPNSGDLEYTVSYTFDDDEDSILTGESGVSFFGIRDLFLD